jgi:hypothetical protein
VSEGFHPVITRGKSVQGRGSLDCVTRRMIHAFRPLKAEGQNVKCVLILDNFSYNCQFRNHYVGSSCAAVQTNVQHRSWAFRGHLQCWEWRWLAVKTARKNQVCVLETSVLELWNQIRDAFSLHQNLHSGPSTKSQHISCAGGLYSA